MAKIHGTDGGTAYPQGYSSHSPIEHNKGALSELLKSRRGDLEDGDVQEFLDDLQGELEDIVNEHKGEYQELQEKYEKSGDESAYKESLDQLINGPTGMKHQVDQAIYQTLSPHIDLGSVDDPLVGHIMDMILEDPEFGAFLADMYGPQASASARVATHVYDQPVSGASGEVPFYVNIPKGGDVYIRVQGIDPNTGKPCYVTWDQNGHALYHDYDPNNPPDPAKYCIKLSDLPQKDGKVEINLPEMTSGRVYFSEGKPLHTENPDPQNTGSPDYQTKWTMMEFTNNGKEIYADCSAVDMFGSPSVQMRMHTDQGDGPNIGYNGDPEAFLKKLKALMQKYGIDPNSPWGKLFIKNAQGDLVRVMSSKHFPQLFKNYYNNYLQNTFLAYYQQGKGGHSLYLQATVNGKQEVLRGQVSADGKTFNFYDQSGKLVTSLPTNSGNSIPWITGATGDWCPGKATTDTQKDLMRDLSAMLNAGIRPQDAHTSWNNPISKAFFKANKGLFYKATGPNGEPMYNVFDRAMHEAGYNGYTYDYDDMLGQDGTQVGSLDQDPSFSVTLNL